MNEQEDLKAIRTMLVEERKRKRITVRVSAVTLLIIIGGIIVFCTRASNQVEAEKKWCRDAGAEEFVKHFEARCYQYRSDPEIKARIDRILTGKER